MKCKNILLYTVLGLSSCSGQIEDPSLKTIEELDKTLVRTLQGRPGEEYAKIYKEIDRGNDIKTMAEYQSAIDSIAYRRVMEGTILAKDSTAVNEFNKIASKNKVSKNYKHIETPCPLVYVQHSKNIKVLKELQQNMVNAGVSLAERNKINELPLMKQGALSQFKADSITYTDFFRKYGVMNDTLKNTLKSAARKIKP